MNENISTLTKIEINDNLDFKYICTYKGFSAALTSCGKLYIWGLMTTKNNKSLLIKSPLLIKNYIDNNIIIDKIYLNNGYLYAIGRILEKQFFIKKLFLLDIKDGLFPILREIKIKDENENIIPLKIFIGNDKTYFLCIKENNLIEEIKLDIEGNTINEKIAILINYSNEMLIEEQKLEKFKEISNHNLIKFIDLYNTFPDKYIKDLIKIFDEIKIVGIKIYDINYTEFITFLKYREEFNELLLFFINNENNEGITLYYYLKTRLALIEENIMKYIDINNSIKSENFIHKIIEQNIIYLNDDFRVQYFYSIVLNLPYTTRIYKITIDRFKALKFLENFKEKKIPDINLKETIFGQLFQLLGNLDGIEFLKEKGQKLFKVELKEENAVDEGGPYSEIISNICDDLQSDYVDLFIKTPNNKSNSGELRDKYIINPNCNIFNYKKAFEFIGKLMILAISSGETLNLNFHPIIWKSLLENQISFKDYESVDYYFFKMINQLKDGLVKNDKNLIDYLDLNFVIQNSGGKDVELIKNGKEIKVTLNNVKQYIDLALSMRLKEIKEFTNYIGNGLYSVIGKNILQILNWKQLEQIVCGEVIFDMKEFKKHTECNNHEKIIIWFWEWLESCKEEDKFKYLKFVSGRSRLPKVKYVHKIYIDYDKDKLPSSHTCFFALDLPNYDTKEILYEKMKYVIENVANITDN